MTAATPTTEAAMDTERKVDVLAVLRKHIAAERALGYEAAAREGEAALTVLAGLIEAVEAYESECANPFMDPLLKCRLRQEMFAALSRLGASA